MNKQQFLTHFLLSSHTQSITSSNIYRREGGIPSAVLIPLIELNNEVFVVLTKRALHLRNHPGQISFPGGKVEKQDKSLIATALRESFEEVGIPPHEVEVISQLDTYDTLTGYRITPIVGFISNETKFRIDKNEVEELFKVPLRYFYQSKHYIEIRVIKAGILHPVNFISYQQYNIWGATAAILKGLANV